MNFRADEHINRIHRILSTLRLWQAPVSLPKQRKRKLEQLREEFCEFRLGRPISVEKVEAVESMLNVTLPEAYRAFLLEVGDGGTGPGRGLLSVSYDGQFRFKSQERPSEGFLDLLNLTDQDIATWKKERVYELLFDMTSADEAERWNEFRGIPLLQLNPVMPGDPWGHALVVSGTKRGAIVTTFSFNPDEYSADFLTWYVEWLESVCRDFDLTPFEA